MLMFSRAFLTYPSKTSIYDTAMGAESQLVKPVPQGGATFAKVNGNGNQSNPNGQGLSPSCSAQPTMNIYLLQYFI